MTVCSTIFLLGSDTQGNSSGIVQESVDEMFYHPSVQQENGTTTGLQNQDPVPLTDSPNNQDKQHPDPPDLPEIIMQDLFNAETIYFTSPDLRSVEYLGNTSIAKEAFFSFSQNQDTSMITKYFIYENIPYNELSFDNSVDSSTVINPTVNADSNGEDLLSTNVTSLFLYVQILLIICGLLYFLFSLLGGKRYTLRKMKASVCADPRVTSIISKITTEYHMKPPRVLIVKSTPNAFVYGYPKTLVLSESLLMMLSDQELRMVVKHELAHVKNHDIILKPFLQMIRIMFVYNPIIHFLYYKMIKERELMADLCYLHDQTDKILFMEALMKINAQLRNRSYPHSIQPIRESSLLSLLPQKEMNVGITERFECLFGKTIRKTLVTSIIVMFLILVNIGLVGVSLGIKDASTKTISSDEQGFDESMVTYTLVVKEQNSIKKTYDDFLLIKQNIIYLYPSCNGSASSEVPIHSNIIYDQQFVQRIPCSVFEDPLSMWDSLCASPLFSSHF
jgi:beta-lactamase regulating signal transducer with metallopeptidase domain